MRCLSGLSTRDTPADLSQDLEADIRLSRKDDYKKIFYILGDIFSVGAKTFSETAFMSA